MNYKTDKATDKNILVLINGKEINRIPLTYAIKKEYTIRYIVMTEIQKSPEIQVAPEFFVGVNGKNVRPKEAEDIYIGDVETIEIFDKIQKGNLAI
jgi:hypothetical protein